MNILHINSYNSGGGSETVFNITRNNSDAYKNFSGFNAREQKKNDNSDISFYSWERNNRFIGALNYIFSFHNYQQLNKFLSTNKVDIVHLHGFFSSISPSILLVLKRYKKKRGIKLIQTVHDFHMICPNASLFNFSKNALFEKCIKRKFKLSIFIDTCDRRGKIHSILKGVRSIVANNCLKHIELIDCYIAPSKFIKEKLIQGGVVSQRIIFLPNPILVKTTNSSTPKENIICYFGRFSNEKNLEFLINAFSTWKKRTNNNFKLHLIGDGENRNLLLNLVKTHSIVGEAIFKDFVPFDILIERLKTVKYFVMSSKWYENAPMSILEAVSQGLVPIVPALGGMRESVEDVLKVGKTYIPENIDSWCNAIDELERSYDIEIEKINSVKEKLNNEFGVDSYLKNLTMLYHKILEDKNL